ncbi:hypothetical protein ACVW0P_001917 [Mucilaginibacter sp. UYNi724]
MKNIATIGIEIPSVENNIKLNTYASLSDIDIAVFAPVIKNPFYNLYESYMATNESYEGKKLYSKDFSPQIKEHARHWKNELSHFVNTGGTLFIILPKKEDFFIYSGTRDVSGSGRNQKITFHIEPFSNYKFLPFDDIKFKFVSGEYILPNSFLVNEFYSLFKEYMSFEAYFAKSPDNPLFFTKNKDRVLGAKISSQKGDTIYLPNINFHVNKLLKHNEKTGRSSWNSMASKVGLSFVSNLIEIENTINKTELKTPKPNWLNTPQYELVEATKTITTIDLNLKKIKDISIENERLQLVLIEQESLKDLLFETGKTLEKAVTKALIILGYTAENYDDGELELDQIIISPEGYRFIGECEGKDNKDIDISKFRQLLDGLNADFEKETIPEKAFGLLIGNPQRLTAPNERTLDFTKKCQQGAEREKIGLIKTSDLFAICKYIIENDDSTFTIACRETIFKQLGKIVNFPVTPTAKL